MVLVHGHILPHCNEDGCENFLEQECHKCGAPRCEDHIARCINCWQLAKPITHFCYSCANAHEREKSLKLSGNCIDEWNATVASDEGSQFDFLYTKDPDTLRQRRIERYKRKGIL